MEFGGFPAAGSDFAWNSEDFGLPVLTVLLIAALHDPQKTGLNCKIVSATEPQYAMELVSEKTAAGTSVKLWPYDDGTAPTHRQWMLVPMPAAGHDDTSVMATRTDEKTLPNPADGIYSISGSRLHAGAGNATLVRSLPRGVYVERIHGTTRKFVVR